jgi:hypothetical protein
MISYAVGHYKFSHVIFKQFFHFPHDAIHQHNLSYGSLFGSLHQIFDLFYDAIGHSKYFLS